MGRAKRNKGRLQDYTQPTASFLPRGSSSIVDRPVDPSCGPSIIAVVHSGFDFRRSSRRLERAERAVRRLPAIQTLGPPSFSSDSRKRKRDRGREEGRTRGMRTKASVLGAAPRGNLRLEGEG
ncbi:uncharacterized protein LOC117209540 isoform X2 [Bombus bifarius]|uniref:Uncharacterized protein LOC117209540 isoform X2 n=1 Tax=Bombus bifarius TaxID=103933 RepID=A0A6P8M283_9HYME|nr:uncharacterized protein LOC117158376 isoform X2 [Bombus vancouverensis nearcticus]XP_033307571.1 uncharacterized protein LOC117209540 isoform X2 [Bombus bifarius]